MTKEDKEIIDAMKTLSLGEVMEIVKEAIKNENNNKHGSP